MAKNIQKQILNQLNKGAVEAPLQPVITKKMSKRLKKKLASTGRTSTSQPINPKMPPLKKAKEELPKVGPKPESPIKPKAPEAPKEDPKIKADADYEKWRKEFDRKQFLVNMIVGSVKESNLSNYLTDEQIYEIEDRLFNASEEVIERIMDLYKDDEDWKEFYKLRDDRESGYYDDDLVIATVEEVMDILGISY